ncbi:MAG: helix-turn-helix transcriptional regulator [Acidobacteriota bacterium]
MDKPQRVNFAQLCKELRKSMDFSQEEMAKHLGVPARTYRAWEYAEREPSAQAAYKLSEMKRKLDQEQSEEYQVLQKFGQLFRRVTELERQFQEFRRTITKRKK